MEKPLKTKAGVTVNVKISEGYKRLIFSKPVRVIELSQEEAIRVGQSLIRGRKAGLTDEIRNLIHEGYFKEPKSFREIRKTLTKRGIDFERSSLTVVLLKLSERGELTRIKSLGTTMTKYLYTTHGGGK